MQSASYWEGLKMDKILAKIGAYEIYSDGTVYDTENAQDIPEYIFIIRDVLTHQAKYGWVHGLKHGYTHATGYKTTAD
jgi:uncharacterized protein YdaL